MIDSYGIREEFDRLALLAAEDGWSPNDPYQDFLLGHVPADCRTALEIGCGTGAFSRLLASRSEQVRALDLSPVMIRLARERSTKFTNIDYRVADAISMDFPTAEFDCVVTIATLHHLPLAPMLSKMKSALKPGGVIIIMDLFEPEGLLDALTSAAALPASLGLRLLREGRLRAPAPVRAAWAAHAKYDRFPTLREMRKACAGVLPGARVRKHLLWRYSVVWQKPRGIKTGLRD